MSKDSIGKILLVATLLCIVCSIVVSVAAVTLRPRQTENQIFDLKRNVVLAAGLIKQGESVSRDKVGELFATLTPKLVELGSGQIVDATKEEIEAFDAVEAAETPESSVEIPSSKDIAGIKRRAKRARIYVKQDGTLILPIHGMGLWSTMYGYIALANDEVRTVNGIVYYQHGETAGLGGEVDNPIWRAQFPGKTIYDASGNYRFEVLKGAGNRLTSHTVDGLSGATITTRGVSEMIKYWLGPEAFGPLLAKS